MKNPKILWIGLLFVVLSTQGIEAQTAPFVPEVFKQRQERAMQAVGNGLAIFAGAKVSVRNSDVAFDFRQQSDFYYLTGLEEPDAILVLAPGTPKPVVLFVLPGSSSSGVWTEGAGGIERAMKNFGADTAYSVISFKRILASLVKGKTAVYLNASDPNFRKTVKSVLDENNPGIQTKPLSDVTEMRMVKDTDEITRMREAGRITAAGVCDAMRAARSGMVEYEIQAVIEYHYMKNGARRPAFPSIVGSGPNTNILHYETNNRRMENGDLLVMDVGAEYCYYASDITRTIPVSGRFTPEQKALYDIVLEANEAVILTSAPGKGMNEVANISDNVLRRGLFRLGLVIDTTSSWQTRIWTLHGASHWLGLDVHDVGTLSFGDEKGKILEPGMVFTVEPGIYMGDGTVEDRLSMVKGSVPDPEIQAFLEKVKPVAIRYKNVGIRIEDDVLITADGREVLSSAVPKTAQAVEKLMAEECLIKP